MVEIPLKLPSLNDYVLACRTNRYMAASLKSKTEKNIILYLNEVPKYSNPVKIHFLWVEGNKRRDYDNICFAKKFVLDALVKGGYLKDDNRKNVLGFTDDFAYGNEFKVILDIEEVTDD